MAVDVKTLTTPLKKEDVLADLYTLLGLLGLTTTALQSTEAVPVILAAVVAWIVDKVWNPLVIPALRAIFLDYSTGDWLSLVAWILYNRPRIVAQAATVSLYVENRSTTSGTVNVAAGSFRVRNSKTGKTYTNSTAFMLAQWGGSPNPYPTTASPVTFEADEVGTASNAAVHDIAAYPTPPVTSPSVGLYPLTNESPVIGSDEEGDANLVTRCRAAVGDLSAGGPVLAYVSAALDPVGAFTRRKGLDGVSLKAPSSWGTAAPAISRVRVLDSSSAPNWTGATAYPLGYVVARGGQLYQCTTAGTSAGSGGPSGAGTGITDGSAVWKYVGTVVVALASTSGPAGGDNATADTDVFKANTAIQLFIVPPGTTCAVLPATSHAVSLGTVTLYVSAQSNVTAAEAIANATAAIDSFFSTLPIGGARKVAGGPGYVYANKVRGIFEAPSYIEDVDLTLNDVAMGATDVAVASYTIQANIVTQ